MKRKKPEMGQFSGIPDWCHHHGSKMKVSEFDKKKNLLIISSYAAKISIARKSGKWFLEWSIRQSIKENVKGCILLTKEELCATFTLSDISSETSKWIISRYGADSALQGKFIRWDVFLNIPCPGTGHDGDPNISIHLDDEIKEAVRQLSENFHD